MNHLAIDLLTKLLQDGERQQAGRRSRAAAITGKRLEPYRGLRNLREREEFEASMRAASDAGAVALIYDRGFRDERDLARVELKDLNGLAAFLGMTTRGSVLEEARRTLQPVLEQHPVLAEVLIKWSELRSVRNTKPEQAAEWRDACAVVTQMASDTRASEGELPIREVSARLFKDSKRIERLTAVLDVLLSGSIDAPPRQPFDVWKELGLIREEQPVRLAGAVKIRRSRVCALLDAPYSAFHAGSVLAVDDVPQHVLTIENQTTFHTEAVKHQNENVLLIYTAGMPSPAWRAMYERLIRSLPEPVALYHWGDIDEGGFRIAAQIARIAHEAKRTLKPFRMAPEDVPEVMRRPATKHTLERIRTFATEAGWEELGQAVAEAGFIVEQEALND
ncbi:Wadjet anti-phage system protein JetD domain-containing protein [Thauera sp. Sel9]|uniref:Wadjet anti-phage system protein JetD domain-containing protein n=1 Tax=Thauera sp. Sel9 TaxID=2974299 RepID=UPI0021E17CFA|nr:Wadjet anti-phage system protein JetD domain-containing protein [Thauera sp. Sel9]MCV2219878.1 DUF2220 family protein [Thauera sp. Sel9]